MLHPYQTRWMSLSKRLTYPTLLDRLDSFRNLFAMDSRNTKDGAIEGEETVTYEPTRGPKQRVRKTFKLNCGIRVCSCSAQSLLFLE